MSLSVANIAAIRFGYGLRPGEPVVGDADGLMAQLTAAVSVPTLFPMDGFALRRREIAAYGSALRALAKEAKEGRDEAEIREERQKLRQKVQEQLQRDVRARIAQSVLSPYGFHERLAGFWLNHFAVSTDKSPQTAMLVPLFEVEAIRANLLGSFADLVKAVSFHPAMMIYLDQTLSVGPNSAGGKWRKGALANENFARELLELHTLGVNGRYGQKDVQQTSLLLSGLVVNADSAAGTFDPRKAEPGKFTILGQTYARSDIGWGGVEPLFVRLSRHESTRQHICGKLVRHFIDEKGHPELEAAMVKAWDRPDGNLASVYRTMLESRRAWAPETEKVKMPFDYVVSVLRAIGADRQQILEPPVQQGKNKGKPDMATVARHALNQMGHPVWRPPAAAGFEEASDYWLNPSQLAERIAFSNRAVSFLLEQPDPRVFTSTALGDRARAETTRLASQAPNRKIGMVLALAAPEFQRR